MKTQMTRKYGPNLKKLFDPSSGDFNLEEFNRGKVIPKAYYKVGDYNIDSDSARSFVLGWVAGMQYKFDFLGDCFVTTAATLESLDYFGSDLENLKKYYNFYNLIVYSPVQVYGNFLATYE